MRRIDRIGLRHFVPFLVIVGLMIAAPSRAQTSLWPGEKIQEGGGHQALVRFWKGRSDKPLVVFVPGALFTARIAYGHPGSDEKGFLAYWLSQEGYSVLAISYPIQTRRPIFTNIDPAFSVRDWGRQTAEISRRYIEAEGLRREVIVLGWSMGGKIVQSINAAVRENNLNLLVYVSLAATPPLPELAGGWQRIKPTDKGLADRRYDFPGWYALVREAGELNDHVIIPEDVFLNDYVGDIPINIQGFPIRYARGAFVPALETGLEDDGSFSYADYPLVAVMLHDGASDAGHVLTDLGTWGLFIVNKIDRDYLKTLDAESLPPSRWRALINLVRGAPSQLSATVHGNHVFFVGRAGAQQTAENVQILEEAARGLKAELAALSGLPVP
jgi:pimeloyl-ACP methyl ester carboxylesterase